MRNHGDFAAQLRSMTNILPSVPKSSNDFNGMKELPKNYANTLNPLFNGAGALFGAGCQQSLPQVSWISGTARSQARKRRAKEGPAIDAASRASHVKER